MMSRYKAEAFVALLAILTGLSGFMSWSVYTRLGGSAFPLAETIRNFAAYSVVLSVLSVACTLLMVYPLLRRNITEHGKLQVMTSRLTERSKSLEEAAVTDVLTGMNNRRYFDDALREYMRAFRKIERPLGMMVLDLDHFKAVNDTHGHDVGDDVLRAVSECLHEFTRHHDVLARIGGEEFAVLTPNISEKQLFQFAQRVRKGIAAIQINSGNVTLKVTTSIGIAIWDGKESGEDFYRRADKELYAAKRSGRNRVSLAA